MFLRNSDHAHYGELLTDYRRQFANDFDIYPKTLEGIINVMRQMPAKRKKPTKNKKVKEKPKEEALVASLATSTSKMKEEGN